MTNPDRSDPNTIKKLKLNVLEILFSDFSIFLQNVFQNDLFNFIVYFDGMVLSDTLQTNVHCLLL